MQNITREQHRLVLPDLLHEKLYDRRVREKPRGARFYSRSRRNDCRESARDPIHIARIPFRPIVRSTARYQRGIKKYKRATCASCSTVVFAGENRRRAPSQPSIARASAFSDSRASNRSAFIDKVDVERNKAAVIAELSYDCVCSLAPGDAATLISKPKEPRSAHVPYKSPP